MSFYDQLKDIRKLKGFTIREVSHRSGVSKSYISQLENGNRGIPSPEILKKLSVGLRISYDELMQLAGYLEQNKLAALSEQSGEPIELRQFLMEHHLSLDGQILSIEDKEWINQMLTVLFWKRRREQLKRPT